MEKNKLLLLPFFAGLILMVYSWYLSYPLSINSVDDFVFNHISILYWFSLPLLLASMFMMAVTSKSNYTKWIISVGIVMTIYSLSYFYYMLPSIDSHYFRGITEGFIRTKDLDPLKPNRGYFQWPSFFLLADMTTSLSGMELATYEFLFYTVIGFLIATAFYVYASRAYKHGGFLAAVAFFVAMFYFFNYQNVPYSLAFGLLFLLFMLETRQKNLNVRLTMLVLFVGMTFVHLFVPLFFVLYLLIRWILNRGKQHGSLLLLTLVIYLIVQITQAQFSFTDNIKLMTTLSAEYSDVLGATMTPTLVPLDVVAQMFSRYVTITAAMICLVGFIILLIKRKMREIDKAILLTGAAYSVFGTILFILGTRAIPLFFIPICLGASFLLESRVRPFAKFLFLILLILFAFIPLHTSFSEQQIVFQTKEAQTTAKFLMDKYDWDAYSTILSHDSTMWYIATQIEGNSKVESDHSSRFQSLIVNYNSSFIENYDCIIYSVGVAKSLKSNNLSAEELSRRILDRFNIIYNSGFSYIGKKR